MTEADVAALLREALLVMLKLAGPMLGVSLAVGLVIAMVQAVTQINEATLAFVPKLLSMGVLLLLLGSFMFSVLGSFTRSVLDRMTAGGW